MFKKLILLIIILSFIFIIKTDKASAQTSCPTLPTNTGKVTLATTTPAGTYRLWVRMKSADSTNNSFYIQINGGCGILVGGSSQISSSNWTWVDYKDGNNTSKIDLNLTEGAHNIIITGNGNGVSIDKLQLTQDLACIPVDFGANCPAVKATPTPSKTLTITSGPAVSNLTSNGATITWYLSDYGSGQIEYGTTTNYGTKSTLQTCCTYNYHIQNLTGLTPGTTYHYRVVSTDSSGNTATSADKTFITFDLGGGSLTSTPTIAPTAIPTSTPIPTNAPTPSPRPTSTPIPTNTPTPLPTKAPIPTPNPLDTASPQVTITSPLNNSLVSRNTNINTQATATDNTRVSKVEFYVNGSLRCTDNNSPYNCYWKTSGRKGSTYSVSAKAYDTNSNTATSTIRVTAN